MARKEKAKEKTEHFRLKLSERQLWLLTAGTAVVYFVYSFFSDGFYQHDEISHYLNMLDFWSDPKVILGNWAKPGFKLLYVVPALGGHTVVLILNCIVAALACYIAYKTAQKFGSAYPLFAFLLLAFQPMWLQLSFRTYSELISSLLLIAAVYFHHNQKYFVSSLLLSYGTMIRQEFIIIAALYGLYLLVQKRIAAAASLAIFPLLTNLAGFLATGDLLYLYTSTLKTGATYESNYPKQGFEHYFLMAPTIFGLLALSLLILYIALIVFKKEKPAYFLIVPAATYFLLHCLFNTQSLTMGASTGGNLRYMIVIAPIVAVLGNLAIERFMKMEDRSKALFFFIPYLVAISIWTTYAHNNVVLQSDVRDMAPLMLGLVAVGGIMLFRSPRAVLGFLSICSIGFALIVVQPLRLSTEDTQIKEAAHWAQQNQIESQHVLVNHSVFFYFYGKSAGRFSNGSVSIDSQTIAQAPVGSYILWDSHYSYRPEWNPKAVQYNYFLNKPAQFKLLKEFISVDRRFAMLCFQKIES